MVSQVLNPIASTEQFLIPVQPAASTQDPVKIVPTPATRTELSLPEGGERSDRGNDMPPFSSLFYISEPLVSLPVLLSAVREYGDLSNFKVNLQKSEVLNDS